MTDRELQNLLPDYLGNRLDDALKAEIEQRLAESGELREALAAAKHYVNAIDALDPVRAPDGFLDNVHNRIHSDRGLLERLFHPLHIKLPVELAGVALTVGLVIVLYNPFSEKMSEQVSGPSSYSETALISPYEAPAQTPPSAPSPKSAKMQAPLPAKNIPDSKEYASVAEKKSLRKATVINPPAQPSASRIQATAVPETELSTRNKAIGSSITAENSMPDDRYAAKEEIASVVPSMPPAEPVSVEKPVPSEPEVSADLTAASSAPYANEQPAFADEETPAPRRTDEARLAKEKSASSEIPHTVMKSAESSEDYEMKSRSAPASRLQSQPEETIIQRITLVANRFDGQVKTISDDHESILRLSISLPVARYEALKKAIMKKFPDAVIKDTTATSGSRDQMIIVEVPRN